jgi:uncharacterized 2Fe-2S/4Fe-4S cluster protein (DUF4445 family)
MPEKYTVQVDFEPIGKRVKVDSGKTILEAAQKGGIALLSVCGGNGLCQDCKVKVIQGKVSKINTDETAALSEAEIMSGVRLACQTRVYSDTKLDVPPDSLSGPQRLQLESLERSSTINPLVRPVDFIIPSPIPSDPIARATLLLNIVDESGVTGLTCSPEIMTELPGSINAAQWKGRALVRRKQVVGLLPSQSAIFGIAVDIGTTKIAFYLLNLETGEIIYKAGIMNPQIAFGEDVISRISYANQSTGNELEMHTLLVQAVNKAILKCCEETSINPTQIVDAVVVGNTAMHHFFAGLPVRQLGEAPYIPAVTHSMELNARKVGLDISPVGMIYLPPNIAGYVGADHVAMLLDTQVLSADDTVIALDIGTNTEISLKTGDKLYSCSCASGPAFEGARIEMGMRAAPGAIEKVDLIHGKLEYSTIDDLPPVGICGSGILDAVAVMLRDSAIDSRGVLQKAHPRMVENNNQKKYLLAQKPEFGNNHDILVSRKDVNEIQLAKAAIRAGIESLLSQAGITDSDIERVIIAGAFGTYISIKSAIQIGMFPDLPLDRFFQIGNAAGAGARHMLLSMHERINGEELAERSQYIELTTFNQFPALYMDAMRF